MANDILVSVVIPAYNTEKYIEETIWAVLTQSVKNIEIIVVDDGSLDNTATLISAICDKDERLVLIKQKNQGVSSARNKGFYHSKGRYISYLDADDVWDKDNLKLWLEKFDSDNEFGAVHSDCQVINSESEKQEVYHNGAEGYLLDKLLLGGKWINGTSGSIYKREVIEKVGGFDPELSTVADQEFFFRVANKYKVGRVAKVTWYYRIHSTNMHYSLSLNEKETLLAYKKATDYKLFKSDLFRRECVSKMYFMLAGSTWVYGNDTLKVVNYLLKSFFTYPPIIKLIVNKVLNPTPKEGRKTGDFRTT